VVVGAIPELQSGGAAKKEYGRKRTKKTTWNKTRKTKEDKQYKTKKTKKTT
jgi:hypothetical protein